MNITRGAFGQFSRARELAAVHASHCKGINFDALYC